MAKKKLHVALIQAAVIWENPEGNRAIFSKKIEAITSITDLIILPEMFTTGFTMHPENLDKAEGQKTIDWMLKIASEKQVAITGSIAFYEKNAFYNRLFFVEPNGKIASYDKRHTFTLAREGEVYNSGNSKLLIDYKGFKICPLICYDLRFPIWSRNIDNYDVLLYVANWPKPRINAWDALLKARAIENMAYCIGVNRIGLDEMGNEYRGHSSVYNVLGKQIVFSKKDEIIYATLKKKHIISARKKLKFLEDKDNFTITM